MEEFIGAIVRLIYVGTIALALFLFSILCLIQIGAAIQWLS